jgi:lipoprotein-anchoring transpeptidase ErfK/SrfK
MRLLVAGTLSAAAALVGSAAAPAAGCDPDLEVSLSTSRVSYAAHAVRPLSAFRRPGRGVLARFGLENVNRAPTVFAVLGVRTDRDCRPRWYRVQLPLRPNGNTGWISGGTVQLTSIQARISIDLSARRVTLLQGGRPVLVTTAAVGSPGTPTPTGRFYVNQRFVTRNPAGVFGPRIIGISAFSPTLRGWPQGGPIAIHGTNNPETIGFAVSHGCIRIRNEDVLTLFRLAPAGTPVEIRM